jgi:protein TonB
LSSWLSQHLTYPVDAEENGIQGRVICAFVVDRDGTVTDVAVKTSVDPSLDNEATRVVASIPSWIPGLKNGDFVKVKYTIPISFVLQSSQRSNTKSALAPQIIVGDCQIEKEVK